ncbi:hypothetical protein H4219_006210 [Mycoemilia scoparia]|uniref:type I protein arginine methyltransferase n=1 Tax=Mycoemilia scoparia TaxID=417184 RepID=A0A9W8DJD0_9FUNG|nr:hypothetical protein H4219_006210 [Mycoemilia scoparia]
MGTDTIDNSNVNDARDEMSHRDPGYFQYYGQLQHQQNMLQDYIRTSAYYTAITQNATNLFNDSIVMDVGAGSGILTYFAKQAGASKVYAVEASKVAERIRMLIKATKKTLEESQSRTSVIDEGAAINQGSISYGRDYNNQSVNGYLANGIQVIESKVEEIRPESIDKVDIIVSEPIGVLLVHERMLESYIYARDKFLKPGGVMFPSSGSIRLVPISDSSLWSETMTKVRFWEQRQFYGVDLRPFMPCAYDEFFSAPVVGCFSPRTILADPNQGAGGFTIDFNTVTMDELKSFTIVVDWNIKYTSIMHGIGGWFDISFTPPKSSNYSNGDYETTSQATKVTLSTSPNDPATHWQQVRLLFPTPLAVNAGQRLKGFIEFNVNDHRSYDIVAHLAVVLPNEKVESLGDIATIENSRRVSGKWYLHEQIYNYSYTGETTTDFKPEMYSMYQSQQQTLEDASKVGSMDILGIAAAASVGVGTIGVNSNLDSLLSVTNSFSGSPTNDYPEENQ